MNLNHIDKIDKFFIKIGEWVSVLFFIVVAIGFFEVVMRYIFNSPTTWVHETTTFIVSIALLYGGVACYADNRHIRMEFIRQSFSKKTQWFLELIVELLMLLFISMLTYGSYCTTRDAFISPFGKFKMQTSGTVLDTPFPALNKGFFLFTCIAILLLSILHLYRHILLREKLIKHEFIDGGSAEPANENNQNGETNSKLVKDGGNNA
ncbi:TRAP transporter small permease [Vibrio sp. JC009]|uniref:TRAP transporter small permease subunit n=1 Tax=Vibrio sp. JC009 TaxID=2912314 RepID=UPI0023B145D8|nr:TRAP transporter small permease [Vibrio sp. JC009]WED24239.1 TRAP transporter small permease [Vibrio sp. JC009]